MTEKNINALIDAIDCTRCPLFVTEGCRDDEEHCRERVKSCMKEYFKEKEEV